HDRGRGHKRAEDTVAVVLLAVHTIKSHRLAQVDFLQEIPQHLLAHHRIEVFVVHRITAGPADLDLLREDGPAEQDHVEDLHCAATSLAERVRRNSVNGGRHASGRSTWGKWPASWMSATSACGKRTSHSLACPTPRILSRSPQTTS